MARPDGLLAADRGQSLATLGTRFADANLSNSGWLPPLDSASCPSCLTH
jgi:hypothetical protein